MPFKKRKFNTLKHKFLVKKEDDQYVIVSEPDYFHELYESQPEFKLVLSAQTSDRIAYHIASLLSKHSILLSINGICIDRIVE